jgi:hypothetical protein
MVSHKRVRWCSIQRFVCTPNGVKDRPVLTVTFVTSGARALPLAPSSTGSRAAALAAVPGIRTARDIFGATVLARPWSEGLSSFGGAATTAPLSLVRQPTLAQRGLMVRAERSRWPKPGVVLGGWVR